MLTNQEIFDKSVGGLLKQGKQAMDSGNNCVYQNGNGLRCAIGQLIDPESYTDNLEGWGIGDLFRQYPEIMNRNGLVESNELIELLDGLQEVHDRNDFDKWPALYSNLAKNYGLNSEVCDAN